MQFQEVSQPNDTNEKSVSRRKLLKALAATSGAVVISQVVPGQWSKPIIESGVLPAHAQGSPTSAATNTPEPTSTNTPQPDATATNTPEPSATATSTSETATDTPTATATNEATATPTNSPFRIFNEDHTQGNGVNNCTLPTLGTGTTFFLSFQYEDPKSQVNNDTKILYSATGEIDPDTPEGELDFSLDYVTQNGNSSTGTITIEWCIRFDNIDPYQFTAQLKNGNGDLSNSVTITISKPIGASSADRRSGGAGRR